MTDILHDSFLDHLGSGFSFAAADVRGALFDKQSWTPAKADALLVDITGAGAIEVAAASYLRTALAAKTASLDGAGHRELFDSSTVDFGVLEAGDDFDTFVAYVFVTDDTDSWLICSIDVGLQTTDGTSVLMVPSADGLFELIVP